MDVEQKWCRGGGFSLANMTWVFSGFSGFPPTFLIQRGYRTCMKISNFLLWQVALWAVVKATWCLVLFQELSLPPQERSLEIVRGGGGLEKVSMEANLEFLGG